ncbi:hypothetical protein [Stenotrophomonas maltophilia]|uniref:hypothetical protein n=1 Tax=Stenotrophomonas maltophilia TaxID=40324 RepID=UPI0020CBBD6A|nr:hypothetical protein [Stenotrophomonas maltophilia]
MANKNGAAAPTTLEEWLNGRPSWLRMAAFTVIQHRRMPNEEEMEALADHCLAEAAKKLDAPHPALAPGTILGTPTAAELRIDSVSSICGVNALGEDAALDLSQGQMTVVYGPNGAGKSGYARLMKHVCGARAKGSIHGNVFKQNPDAASALIKVTATRSDGTTSSADLTWQASDGAHSTLKAVPVFDSATALEFGDSATTATHLPRAMRFVGMLIHISDDLATRLKARAAKLTSKLPIIPEEHAQSSAATVLRKLTAKLTEEDINQRCAFPAALNDERLALETALAQANPEVAHAKAVGELERLSQMATSISALKESLNGRRPKPSWMPAAMQRSSARPPPPMPRPSSMGCRSKASETPCGEPFGTLQRRIRQVLPTVTTLSPTLGTNPVVSSASNRWETTARPAWPALKATSTTPCRQKLRARKTR